MSLTTQPANRSPWRMALALFVFLNLTYLLTSTGRLHTIDEVSTVMETESLVVDHSTAIPQAVKSQIWYGKRGLDGKPYSPYPPGQPIVAAPWYWMGLHVLMPLSRAPQQSLDLVLSMATTFSSATFAAAAVALAFLLAFALGCSERESLVFAMFLALASPLFVYSAWLFSESLTTALWMGAALALFGIEAERSISAKRAAIAGLLLGYSLWIRPTNAIAAAFFVAAIVLRHKAREWRPAMIVMMLAFLAGLLYLARNSALYGNMSDFGYPARAEGGRELNSFHTPFLIGFTGFLISPGKGVFLFFPGLVLALTGLKKLWRRDRGLGFAATSIPIAYLLFYSKYSQWEGIYSWGPRYLVPSLALIAFGIAAHFLERRQWLPEVLGIFFITGMAIQLIGLSTNLLEDMVRNQYYYSNWQYRWNYSALTGQLSLLGKYLSGAPSSLGYGFDRWFVFLRKAGAPSGPVWALLGTMLVAWVAAAWWLHREWGKTSES